METSSKIDIHVAANLGLFGLLRPDEFSGAAVDKKSQDAIGVVLDNFTFPSINFIFSTSARLRVKNKKKLAAETKLEEAEFRVKLEAFTKDGLIPDSDRSSVAVLGLFPDETAATEKEPLAQLTPNRRVAWRDLWWGSTRIDWRLGSRIQPAHSIAGST